MATIRLDRDETRDLPDVCMKCGRRATETVTKNFSWMPPWARFIGIIGLAFVRRMTVDCPMCREHKNHWFMRNLILGLSLLAVFGLVGLMIVVILASEEMGFDPGAIVGLLGIAFVLGLLGWLVLVFVLSFTAIRPQEITEYEITLAGVSEGFVEAVEEMRDEEEDNRSRRRKKRRR